MIDLNQLVHALDNLFRLDEAGPDPSFSRQIPAVYAEAGVEWRSYFDPHFATRFNGLMVRGDESVGTVFVSVFPREEVLQHFITHAQPGDLFFSHHPLDMETGDPRGQWGRGFLPIPEKLLRQMQRRRLSYYAVHVPLDYNEQISTGLALVHQLQGRLVDHFLYLDGRPIGQIAEIASVSTEELMARLLQICDIPYVDFEGPRHDVIRRIAVVAGCGDKVAWMEEAERLGVQAYVTGEVHCHIDNDYGRMRYQQMMDYVARTPLSLIGVSHAASEQVVLKTEMAGWFREHFQLPVEVLSPDKWWQ